MTEVILLHALLCLALKPQASSPGVGLMAEVEKPQSLKLWRESRSGCGGSERWKRRARYGWPAEAPVSPALCLTTPTSY